MKLSALFPALILPLAIQGVAIPGNATQGDDGNSTHWEHTRALEHNMRTAVCWRRQYALDFEWKVTISPVPQDKVGHICHKFWKGLKQFGQCIVTGPNCASWEKHGVQAHFHTASICNGGMVQSAFWEATHNEYGSVNCYK